MTTKLIVPMIAITPMREKKAKSRYSKEEKRSLLDNFDLEVADKTNHFRDSLSATLESFLRRQETEMLRIPRDLRGLTLRELMDKWGGSWKETMQRMTKERMDVRERERAREEAETREKAAAEAAGKGKRKRGTLRSVDSTPIRSNKNARRTQTPAAGRTPLAPSSATNTSRRTGPSRSKAYFSTPIKPIAGPSSLPQDHKFQPSLPFNNLASLSAPSDDSPSSMLPSHGHDLDSASDSDVYVSSSEDEDDLPDPEAYEARVLAKSTSKSSRSKPSKPSANSGPKGKLRRAPSLYFRRSLLAGEIRVQQDSQGSQSPPGLQGEDEVLCAVDLGDGRSVSFNPFRVNPDRVRLEIAEEAGLSETQQISVAAKIREEILDALTAQMGKWKVLS